MAKLEVCVSGIQSALNAEKGGAHRIELCDNLLEGGTTPSAGTIIQAKKALSIPVHVIIRPRGGDFLYTPREIKIMEDDIKFCKKAGVAGIVIGALQADGSIDRNLIQHLCDRAGELAITFHRAIDMTQNIFSEMLWLLTTPVTRVLTSGQQNTAPEGVKLIKELINEFGEDLIIMPGSGLNDQNISNFHNQVSAPEYHATLRSGVKSEMNFQMDDVSMSTPGFDEFNQKVTDPAKVARFVSAISK